VGEIGENIILEEEGNFDPLSEREVGDEVGEKLERCWRETRDAVDSSIFLI
jgi:hypothetical protein